MAVVAASERALAPLVATASRSGWRTVAGSAESIDPLAMTTMLLDAAVRACWSARAIRPRRTNGAPSASWPPWSPLPPAGGGT